MEKKNVSASIRKDSKGSADPTKRLIRVGSKLVSSSHHVVMKRKNNKRVASYSRGKNSFITGMGRAIDLGATQSAFPDSRFSKISSTGKIFNDSWAIISDSFGKAVNRRTKSGRKTTVVGKITAKPNRENGKR